MDWHAWHERYDRPGSSYPRRLETVQARLREELDRMPPGPLRIVSLCGGQGHDVVGALTGHPRAADARVRLVELDPRNVEAAREAAAAAGLEHFEAIAGDAADTAHLAGAVPADIALVCGLFGNISDSDIERTVDHCTELVRDGGAVIWTRHRQDPDTFPAICGWFEERGFTRQWVSAPDAGYGVGVHRSTTAPRPLAPGASLFTFVGYDVLRAT
ncbi:methyltransferase domain-containing protein [Streptomyces sp. NRRL F-5123]|uniref:methyltransferase domain-containing protein n=1 Tax=Streptomyces sp. NRRL F-5123 TaxID=1463856 RepID=UPI0004E226D1|nr:methyltransferase domain-containing protein [Streptomyces sp. NRRL F-5123]